MKQYLKFFRWIYVVIGLLAAALLIINGLHNAKSKALNQYRTNTECTTKERVFDYGEVLTEQEEQNLRELIAKRQAQTGCDIVLVTLNQSLKEYAKEIEPNVSYSEFVRVYAEQFYEKNKFGYDKPNGDGVILVDNWYREDDGRIYTWLCTTGIVKDTYSASDIDHILDRVYQYVENDPYKAYQTYIEDFYDDMMGSRLFDADVPKGISFILGGIAAILFFFVNFKSRSGKNTTTAVTYLDGKKAQFANNQDTFIRKSVIKRHIDTSSSGSGGHSSGGGGGGSHGGGGHSR